NVADPNRFALLSRPDLRAMRWMDANLPTPARILVEGFPIYGDTSAVGSDGGWWISLLAGRENTLPPQYAMLNEAPVPDGYTQDAVDLVNQLAYRVNLDSPQGLTLLCRYRISHVYIGQSQGLTGAGALQLFSPREVERQPALRAVYAQDRVRIYALETSACAP
ncbi:MAG: hypothetical protein L0Z70_01950, partial [Chloroflexi bacterium]|nr:hypothetical protein [Chloroflexota bacterium]